MKKFILFLSFCLVASCIGYKDPSQKDMDQLKVDARSVQNLKIPDQWIFDRNDTVTESMVFEWIEELKDDELKQLIKEAVQFNSDIIIAEEKLNQARLTTNIASSYRYPTVGANINSMTNAKNLIGVQRIGVEANWEVDLWGKNKSIAESSNRDFFSAEFKNIRLTQSISATVAKNYFLITAGNSQIEKLRLYKGETQKLKDLFELRKKVGIANDLDISNVQAELIQIDSQIEKLTNATIQNKRSLQTLIGRYPDGLINSKAEFPVLKTTIPEALPLSLLENRPDFIAANFKIEKAFFDIQEAKANRLPTLGIGVTVGAAYTNIDWMKDFFSNPFVTVLGGLSTPIFNYGRLKNNVEIKNSLQKQAVEEYSKLMLTSLNEVENALGNIKSSKVQYDFTSQAIAELNKNIVLTQKQIEIGSNSNYTLIQKQRDLIKNELSLIDLQLMTIIERINLYMAIGAKNQAPYF